MSSGGGPPLLGYGTTGTVQLVDPLTVRKTARNREQEQKSLYHQCVIYNTLKTKPALRPYIPVYKGCGRDVHRDMAYIEMQYIPNSQELFSIISNWIGQLSDWERFREHLTTLPRTSRSIGNDILAAVMTLHTEKFAHGDIKPENIHTRLV